MLGRSSHPFAAGVEGRLPHPSARAPHHVEVEDDALRGALIRTGAATASWLTRSALGETMEAEASWLLQVPDVGPACEVVLADQLFHDLSSAEREGLLGWIRSAQDPRSGAWRDLEGNPDLSLTALGWWACVQAGDDPRSERLVRARRMVHALGGAQRANFSVRLWLALGGIIPWQWLPAVPSELWLLPEGSLFSPARMSPWARAMLTPYLVLAHAPARLQLADASSLLLPRSKDAPVTPRLTRPGLAGDLLQTFDRTVKLARKLPRGRLLAAAMARVERWIVASQQAHGGWFSFRPTVLSLLALRVMGVPSNDPRLRRGLDHLRRSRGIVLDAAGRTHLAQGLFGAPTGEIAGLLRCHPEDARHAWLIRQEIDAVGPWQLRAETPAGGWPLAAGARSYLDVFATCQVLDALDVVPMTASCRDAGWAAARRASDVLFAMQEADGGFARFERGEAEPPLRKLPWHDADLLAFGCPGDDAHLQLSATVLARLGRMGFRSDDDRLARGLQWIERHAPMRLGDASMATLAALAGCLGALTPSGHELRRAVEHQLRGRQGEDGAFGSPVDTARALSGLLDLDAPCVQARRAARRLIGMVGMAAHDDDLTQPPAVGAGIGLSPRCIDASAGPREVHLALTKFASRGTSLEETRS